MSSDTLVIISGASRGLGQALTHCFVAEGAHVVSIARRKHADQPASAARLDQIEADLSTDTGMRHAASQIESILKGADAALKRVILINNAGTVDPVDVAQAQVEPEHITRAFALNVTAPLVLTAAVLTHTPKQVQTCQVLNISSGAGRNPSPGWSVYCATKAALDMATRVLNVEQAGGRVRAVSLAPGVIDTDMQANIRSHDATRFPVRDKFLALHADGKLTSAENVALRIRQYLNRDDFGTTEIDDIRHYD